jgi:hypothetical protein
MLTRAWDRKATLLSRRLRKSITSNLCEIGRHGLITTSSTGVPSVQQMANKPIKPTLVPSTAYSFETAPHGSRGDGIT